MRKSTVPQGIRIFPHAQAKFVGLNWHRMAVTVEMQNTGDSTLKADVVASIEHALADRPGDWRVSIIHFPSVIRLRTGSVRFPKSAVWAAVPASGQESAQRRAGQFPAIQKMVDEFGLHRLLQPDCARLFKDGHLNEAVRKALEKYETYVQQTSALSKIGVDLMANAFNERRRTIHSC